MLKDIDMVLPPRGTGLLTGRARTVRGGGIPLTESERRRRHFASGAMAVDPVWIIAGLALGSAALIWIVTALKKT